MSEGNVMSKRIYKLERFADIFLFVNLLGAFIVFIFAILIEQNELFIVFSIPFAITGFAFYYGAVVFCDMARNLIFLRENVEHGVTGDPEIEVVKKEVF